MFSDPFPVAYIGEAGHSTACLKALMNILKQPYKLTVAKIVTNSNYHAFLLTIENANVIAVRSGFTSGYGGGGPTAFSKASPCS